MVEYWGSAIMNNFRLEQSLSQMRIMQAQASAREPVEAATPADFSTLLKSSLDEVNDIQLKSSDMQASFEVGENRYSLAQVMIASQKADVAFQGALQVRNKLVEAYKDVMNMSM
ncbi:MAG: flagellar hook-basal body complex protein FliE [Pseudomonadota bacterium]